MDLSEFAELVRALNANIEVLSSRVDLLSRRLEGGAPVEPGGDRLRRLGKLERHCAEAIPVDACVGSVLYLPDFVKACALRLPPPARGRRDTRRQNVVRAIKQLALGPEAFFDIRGRELKLLRKLEAADASDLL